MNFYFILFKACDLATQFYLNSNTKLLVVRQHNFTMEKAYLQWIVGKEGGNGGFGEGVFWEL